MTAVTPAGRGDPVDTQMLTKIKAQAQAQLAEGGSDCVSLNAIARALGVSVSALNWYYASRDDLVQELAADGWDDLADTLEAAAASARHAQPSVRLRRILTALRTWANAGPRVYRLSFASGYVCDLLGTTRVNAAARRNIVVLVDALVDAICSNPGPALPAALSDQVRGWTRSRSDLKDVPADLLELAVLTWTRIHGLVSLEIQVDHMSTDLDPELLADVELQDIVAGAVAWPRRSDPLWSRCTRLPPAAGQRAAQACTGANPFRGSRLGE